MAIYTQSSIQYNGTSRESIEDIINDDRVVPSESDDFVSEGMEVILGMTENYNMVMEHIGRSELLALEETGEQLIYTEGVIGSIFRTIKKFLSKVWEKIKSLFKRFIMIIDSYTKNDKAFINKYRQQIYRHKSLSDFTFKGYKYTIDTKAIDDMMDQLETVANEAKKNAINNPSDQGQNTPEKLQKDIIDKLDDLIEASRGDILSKYPKGKAGKYTAEEFRKELKALLRNGEDEKQELDGSNSSEIDVDGMVTELQNYRETKKAVDTAFRDSKKVIDNDNKEVDRLSKEHSKSDDYKNTGNTNDDYYLGKSYTIANISSINNVPVINNITLSQIINILKQNNVELEDDAMDIISKDLNEAFRKRQQHAFVILNTKDKNSTINYKGSARTGYISLVFKFETVNNKVVAQVSVKEKHKRQGKFIQIAFRLINETKQILVDIDTIVLQALKERSRQYKACLVKIVYHNPKNEESYNESYSYDGQFRNSYISPLSNIEFK